MSPSPGTYTFGGPRGVGVHFRGGRRTEGSFSGCDRGVEGVLPRSVRRRRWKTTGRSRNTIPPLGEGEGGFGVGCGGDEFPLHLRTGWGGRDSPPLPPPSHPPKAGFGGRGGREEGGRRRRPILRLSDGRRGNPSPKRSRFLPPIGWPLPSLPCRK